MQIPGKHQKTLWSSDVFKGRERVHWKQMGLSCELIETMNLSKCLVTEIINRKV